MRNNILKCLGKFPEKTNLDIKEIANIDYGNYNEILIEYNVEAGERVQNIFMIYQLLLMY